KLDALAALDQGAREECVRAYLQARTSVDDGSCFYKLIVMAADDDHLKDNAAYLYAAITYSSAPEEAIAKFSAIAARYPHSEKREAALYMAALAMLKTAPGLTDDTYFYCEGDCRKRMREAQAGFRRVLHDYPNGRLYADAQGWIAYSSLKLGDRAGAMAEYYRMLGANNEASRIEALYSLAFTRDDASDADLARVERLIENEPDAALAYAYHNIYNFALQSLEGYDADRGKADRYESNVNELKRIVAFATRMMNRYGSNRVGSGFMVRVAEASRELGNDAEAARLARRALNAGASADIRAEALWIEGVAHYHLKHLKEARALLTTLVAENPNNRYTEGARRNLAMIAEDMNDLDGALEQYLAL
ncbi:MAG TPA: outer membrane protein assembly factor BamD, partial [Burkholderiales bacterium]|nr:outer membrane protein assembly factor BamD [Burkholderiales bacterium]